MKRGKHKAVTFDAMVKFFIHQYDIPTKRDIDKLHTRLCDSNTARKLCCCVEGYDHRVEFQIRPGSNIDNLY